MAVAESYEPGGPSFADRQEASIDVLMSMSTQAIGIHPETQTPIRAGGGRHRQPPVPGAYGALETVSPKLHSVVIKHVKRLFSFSLIGAFVFVAGTALQWLTIGRWGSNGSYAIQCIFSVELSYFLNRWFTWRDRDTPHSLVKWNVQRIGLTIPNWLGYAVLVHFGVPWLAANIAITAVFTVLNYVAGDIWSFRRSHAAQPLAVPAAAMPRPADWMPTVSVVIPCKGNQPTIRATAAALLAQDYPNLIELILVGDVGDTTWQGLEGITDPRLVVLEHEVDPKLRDPNVKRHKGLNKAHGEVLALADSDIVMDSDWLTRAVGLLRTQGSGMVAGGMRSIHDTFWGRFVDGNVVAAKTPRLPRPYLVTAERFGKRGYKPPISANAVFTRDLYEATPLDVAWFYGYEDYEWLWRVARDGHSVLFSGELTAAHHHRRSYRKLLQEYARASEGCAAFVRRHPQSPLARKRLTQAITLPLLALVGACAAAVAIANGYAEPVGAAMLLGFLLLAGREVARTRRLEAVTYPIIGLSLAGAFAINLAKNLIVPETQPIDRVQTWDEKPLAHKRTRRRWRWPLFAILAVQTGISMILLRSNSAFTDEALYLWAGHLEWAHWLHGTPLPDGGGLTQPFQTYFSGAPQIYPPIGALADWLGGITAARVLGMTFMLGATLMLYLVAAKLFDRTVAVSAAALWSIGEPTLRLAFATFDPVAVFFASLAVWLIVHARSKRRHGEIVAAAAVVAALSSVIAYSNAVFLPVIFVVAFMVWRPVLGPGRAAMSTAWLAAATVLTFLGLLTILHDWPGIIHTVFARDLSYDHQPLTLVVDQSWTYSGVIPFAALGSAALAVLARAEQRWFVSILALSSLVVPLAQIHATTAWSIDKHLAEGLWFAAIAAGYGCAQIVQLVGRQWRQSVAAGASVLLAFPLAYGAQSAWKAYHYWPNATSFVSAFRKVVASQPGPILVEQGGDGANTVAAYSTKQGMDWSRWANEYSVSLSRSGSPASWTGSYESQLARVDAGTIAVFYKTGLSSPSVPGKLLFGSSSSADSVTTLLNLVAANSGLPGLPVFTRVLEADSNYRLVAIGPYDGTSADWTYAIWVKR